MSGIVQATCPGCKNLLRIPADWVNQPIRCKHCGLVMLSKNPQTAAAALANRQAPRSHSPSPPKAAAAPVAALAAPRTNGSPFVDLHRADDRPAASRRRAARRNRWWLGPVIALSVFVLAVGILAFAWPKLSKLLPATQPSVAVKDKDGADADKDAGPPKDGTKDGPPADGKADPNKDKANLNKDKSIPAKDKTEPAKDKSTPPKDKTEASKDKSEPPKDKTQPAKDKTEPVRDKPEPPRQAGFPRRALVISVHNYLYSEQVNPGRSTEAHNISVLPTFLNRGLRIPTTQIALLSDFGPRNAARAPTKSVIQETLAKFVATSRAQDRLLVFFVGHAVEIGEDVYLVPIEGEPDKADGLIPLKWVFKELADCKARQKVLVLDVGRANSNKPPEQPGIGTKLNALIANPPDGVQIWSSCSAEQSSFETDGCPMGVFLDKLEIALQTPLNNKIQRPEESMPIDLFNERVVGLMQEELNSYKLKQVPRITGKEPSEGTAFNRDEQMPPTPTLAAGTSAKDNAKIIQSVLDEISLPPIKPAFGSTLDYTLRVEMLPPFDAKIMAQYPLTDSKLRDAIHKVRVSLWAYTNQPEPPDLKKDVQEKRKEFGNVNTALLRDSFRLAGPEADFKKKLGDEERDVGKMLSDLRRLRMDFMDTEKDMPGDLRKEEPSKRWQANYDYVLGHLEAAIGFLYAYQSLLGSMRKELPPKEPGHNGWRMVSVNEPTGDADGKKMMKASAAHFDAVSAGNPATPWFVFAKREKSIPLGLEWKSIK